ncbi:MAG: PAS domain S-box protein, partial [Actinomycetota bacterium]|nr:PAS domain S-box protein [Actinomycetota bacterium]
MAELNRLGAMQPEADRVLQELVDDAREVLGTEFCMVNLVTADAQFFKVWSGEMPPEIAAARQTPRERSMCRHVVEDERQFVVEDFLTTERFREQHLRMGPGIRFYAGTPLRTSEGHAIGSLCLVDSRPREFDGKDEATLRAFARAVVGRLEALGAAAHEREAKESERQYRQNVFELANDAILIYGTETGLILDANRRACEMYGLPQERLVGKKVAELSLEPGDEEGYVRELLHRGAHRGFETVHRRADGAPMDVSVNSSVIEYGGQRAVLSINRDVTRRRRAEEEIRRSHARNNAILQASPDLTFLFNRDGEFLDFEATAKEEQLYVPAEAIIGRRLGDMMPAEIAETALRFIVQALDTGELQVYEYRLSMQDGPRDFEARLVKSGANEVLSIVRDVTERRRTEEALRLSERSLAQAQRIARIGNWEHELGENRTHWSDEMYRIFGLAPRDLVPSYRTFMLFVHPDDKRRVEESVRAALYGSGPEDIEYRIVRPDGEVRSIYTQYEAVYDATGRPLKFFGTVQDVTEHKEAEQKLKEAERKYRLLVEQIPAVAYIDRADVPDAASYTSPRIETLLGYTPEEWLNGRLWLERLHPEDRDWVLETDTRARAAEEPFCEEYRLIAKDGRTVWVRDESELLRDEAGRPLLWQGILIDITERKRVEEELRQSEARFRTIFERSAMGISIADRDRRLLETNPAYQSMLGYSGKELLGKPIAEISHPEDVPDDDELNAALVAGDLGSYRREKRYVRKDGEVIWVCPTISVVRDADGEPQFLVGMVEDITERKKREERLREAEEKYRTLVEQTPAVTYIEALDEEAPGQDTLYISPQIEDLLGYSPEEWTSDAGLFERLLHPEDRERVLAEDARTERTGEPFRMEYRLIARDGRTVWVRDDAVQVKSEEGRPLYWQGVVYDVTERKEAEAALRESEERL